MTSPWATSRGKRVFDIVGATVALTLTLPITVVLAVLIRLKMGRPVFFRHTRAGKDGHPFVMVKFRSMLPEPDSADPMPEEARITPLGRWMRATSLDELPELLNVLRGDMSLVGPRPLILEYVPRYSPEQAERLHVRPGVTGLAQVGGPTTIEWSTRFGLDTRYVREASLRMDLSILFRTVGAVISRRDIAAEGFMSAPMFMGDEPDAAVDDAEEVAG